MVTNIFSSEKASQFFSWAFWRKRYYREEVFLPRGMRVPTERLGRRVGSPSRETAAFGG